MWVFIGYDFEDVKEAIQAYCFKHYMTLWEFLERWWLADQNYRTFEKQGYIPVLSMRKLREMFPDIDLRKVKMAHGFSR